MAYPCPACGFEFFEEPSGCHEICEICDWQDDPVQLLFPSLRIGANKECLHEAQRKVLGELPLSVPKHKGYCRDPLWRPLTEQECQVTEDYPKSGLEYFEAAPMAEVEYYWRRDANDTQ